VKDAVLHLLGVKNVLKEAKISYAHNVYWDSSQFLQINKLLNALNA